MLAGLEARALVRELDDSTDRIAVLVGGMKEYSAMDRGDRQATDVRAGLESTLTILQHKLKRGHVRVERAYDGSLSPIEANGGELNQVWTNLLDNAVDAVDGDGTVRVRTRREADSLVVEIGDDGPGIAPDLQSRIFDPFVTTKAVGRGTGLGLPTSHRIVAAHCGQISVESVPGDTRFVVRLPLSETPAPAKDPP